MGVMLVSGDGGGNGLERVVSDESGVVTVGGVFHGPRNRLLSWATSVSC
jgi:hypothetical protein